MHSCGLISISFAVHVLNQKLEMLHDIFVFVCLNIEFDSLKIKSRVKYFENALLHIISKHMISTLSPSLSTNSFQSDSSKQTLYIQKLNN